MRKRFIFLPVIAIVATLFGGVAQGHSCPEDYEGNAQDPECEETTTVPNWRDGNYIPLFDIEDRDDPEQRRDAQRWQEECDNWQEGHGGYQSRQMCFWMYGGFSLFPNRGEEDRTDPNNYAPNEWHAGFAASHCFLMEAAHQCEDHYPPGSEGTHDAHGGALYADICVSENPDSKYCDDGLEDTQVGVTIMDHNPCGTVIPIVACTDEYHVVRPFDTEYTMGQMEDSQEYIQRIADDPETYLFGCYPDPCPGDSDGPGFRAGGASMTGTAGNAGHGTGVATAMAAARAASGSRIGSAGASGITSVPIAASSTAASVVIVALVLVAFVTRATKRLALR